MFDIEKQNKIYVLEPPKTFFEEYNSLHVGDVALYRFTPEQIQPILEQAKIANKRANLGLVGNIDNEFYIDDHSYVESLVSPIILECDKVFAETRNISKYFTNGKMSNNLEIDTLWVNYQKKHEFNPIHNHIGIYSFVIWLDVPYDIQNEKEYGPGITETTKCSGMFSYYTFTKNGKIFPTFLEVDKKWNGTIAIFPSWLYHQVYPFFTSDDYRITVAGNYTSS